MSCDMRHDEPTSLTQGAGVVPPAYVEPHIVAAGTADGCGYGGVALSLVEREAFAVLRCVTAAEIHFYEIESCGSEEKLGILAVMAVHADTPGYGVVIVIVAACIATGIAVDSGFEPEGVDMIHHRFEPTGKSDRMDEQGAVAVAAAEVAVVDVDIAVAGVLQSVGDHGVGLAHDQRVADVDPVGVPGTPAHGGAVRGRCRQYRGEEGCSAE